MTTKKKIAILGGGVSAMTAACYLTEKDNWQTQYDITVYQMGWRLGGKGASGRNAKYGQRIEEHGLHVWFGFYANSFTTLQKVYADLDRPMTMPLATFDQAFKPHSFIALEENIQNTWKTWGLEFPLIPGNPADTSLDPTFWDLIQLIYYWVKEFTVQMTHLKGQSVQGPAKDQSWFSHIIDVLETDAQHIDDDIYATHQMVASFIEKITHPDRQVADQQIIEQHIQHQRALSGWLNWLKQWIDKEFANLLAEDDNLRHLFIGADLAIITIKGIIEDDVYHKGFGYLNQWDFREWLTIHGANEKYSVNSAPVRGFYDLVFGYENGDFSKPNIEAGVALLAIIRIALCYRGGVMWKMQAGMGDVIFAPIYEVLKNRGVKFEYFHKVEELIPNPSADQIATIVMTEQVKLKVADYDPFVHVKGLPCWPCVPNYQQIDDAQAALLQSNDINLESFWTNWPDVYQQHYKQPLPQKVLTLGVDFDQVIFGISVGGLEHICPQLLSKDVALKTCSEEVKTVATQAFQVWTDVDYSGLDFGYVPKNGEEPILSGFVEPYDTWAAMNQLLCREDWPQDSEPKNVAYFCSAQTVSEYPPASEHSFPAKCTQIAKDNAISYLNNDVHYLWPNVATQGTFNWSILTDQSTQVGEERFDSQYWRSNVDPSERYVMSVKNSSQYRLATDGTQFSNLFLTGDWITTGINAGCVEAATMAGMETSRAVCGFPETINGEYGFEPYKK